MARRIEFLRSAAQQFEALDASVRQRVSKAIDRLEEDAFFPGTKTLQGYPDLRRCRVGDCRIVYTVNADTVTIVRIGNRGEIYRHLDRAARQRPGK